MAEVKVDSTLSGAVELAREALAGIAEPGTLGEHARFAMDAERLGTHYFSCTAAGYRGWYWAVTVARAPRLRTATVCETELVAGDEALLSPDWVPYEDRLKPGDLGAGDVTPFQESDPNLEQGFEATGEEDVDQMAFFELGLGRRRVLSREGRETAAARWRAGDHGPGTPMARKAGAECSTCGYLVPMPGVLRQSFGVCANEWSPADGAVVALDFGCGAHSETEAPKPEPLQVDPPVVDDSALEVHESEEFRPVAVQEEAASEGAEPEAAAPEDTEPELVESEAPESPLEDTPAADATAADAPAVDAADPAAAEPEVAEPEVTTVAAKTPPAQPRD